MQPGFCRAGLHRGQRMSTGQAQRAGNPRSLPLPAITAVGQGLGDTGAGSSRGREGQPTEPEATAEWLVRAGGQNCSTTYSGDRGIPNTALISIWRRAQTCLPATLQPGVATWLSLLSGVTTAVCHLLVMPSEGTGMCAPVPSHQRGCRHDGGAATSPGALTGPVLRTTAVTRQHHLGRALFVSSVLSFQELRLCLNQDNRGDLMPHGAPSPVTKCGPNSRGGSPGCPPPGPTPLTPAASRPHRASAAPAAHLLTPPRWCGSLRAFA